MHERLQLAAQRNATGTTNDVSITRKHVIHPAEAAKILVSAIRHRATEGDCLATGIGLGQHDRGPVPRKVQPRQHVNLVALGIDGKQIHVRVTALAQDGIERRGRNLHGAQGHRPPQGGILSSDLVLTDLGAGLDPEIIGEEIHLPHDGVADAGRLNATGVRTIAATVLEVFGVRLDADRPPADQLEGMTVAQKDPGSTKSVIRLRQNIARIRPAW
jgi:hypothetical protein